MEITNNLNSISYVYRIVLVLFFIPAIYSCQPDELELESDKVQEVVELSDEELESPADEEPINPEDEEPMEPADEEPESPPDPSPILVPTKISILGPLSGTNNITYPQISSREYSIELDRWDISNTRKDAVKTTENIQAAIDWAVSEGYGVIKLPAGHYLIGKEVNGAYQGGIDLKDNMSFVLDKDAIVEMGRNDKWNSCAINISNKKNVMVSGGTVKGDRSTHNYVTRASDGSAAHDEGHCICVQARSENVTIENMVLREGTGDGILLVAQDKDKNAQVKNITIRNNNIGYNRRQGISVVGAGNVLIENNEIHHTKGVSPQHGIDIESFPYKSNDIVIRSNYLHNNIGQILNFDGVNTIIEGNYMEQGDDLDRHLEAPVISWNKASVIYRYNYLSIRTQSEVSNWNGFLMNSYTDINNENFNLGPHEILNNTFDNCGVAFNGRENKEDRVILVKENDFDFGRITARFIDDITMIDNDITHDNRCWPYYLQDCKGSAEGNTYNGKPTIGLDALNWETVFTGACQED